MAADFAIHVRGDLTDAQLKCHFSSIFGSPYMGYRCPEREENGYPCSCVRALGKTEAIGLGEVSWLKYALTGSDEYIPGPIEKIADLIGDLTCTITPELVEAVDAAFTLPNDSIYQDPEGRAAVRAMLERNVGDEVFHVAW